MYQELKALHIISVVAWFAGLFYIFRLFVYHRQNAGNAQICVLFSVMEARLLRAIVFPAAAVTILTGSTLVLLNPSFLEQPWLWAKLTLVFLLLLYQALAYGTFRRFRRENFYLSETACRILNEVPTGVLIGVVFLVVLKPWT